MGAVTQLVMETIAGINNCPPDGSVTRGCLTTLPEVQANNQLVQRILQVVFGVAGALSVMFVVWGGFKYVKSSGEPQELSKAKNTVIYALVGLVIAILAEAIVTFFIGVIT